MRRLVLFTLFLTLSYTAVSFAGEIPTPLYFQDGPNAPERQEASEWNFDVPRGPSRTEGVAPVSIFFSAGLTKSSPTERSFHNYDYHWDFGDSLSGTWGTSGKPKNMAKGPVSAHIYETPGTYYITLTVRNHDGVVDSDAFTITVTDPDTVFSGTKTTCITDSAHDDFAGCPTGAQQITTNDISTISDHTDAGERVLLHRGSSWTLTGSINFPKNYGPVSIGAYGVCMNPTNQGICSNAPEIRSAGDFGFLKLDYKHDWRLADVKLIADKTATGFLGGIEDIKQFLMLRVSSEGFNVPAGWSHFRSDNDDYIEQMTLASCSIRDSGTYGIYVGAERLALLGNIIENTDLSHVARVWQSYQGVISHNKISGSCLTSTSGRQALKLHGPAYWEDGMDIYKTMKGPLEATGKGGLRNYTSFTVVSSNTFGTSGPWPISIGPQDNITDERLSDILFEKNRYIADYGQDGPSMNTSIAIRVASQYTTIRNNIIDGTGAGKDFFGVFVARSPATLVPTGIQIYNNTIYRGDTLPQTNGCTMVKLDNSVADSIVKNNYSSFPNYPSPVFNIQDDSGAANISNNALVAEAGFTDANNQDPLARDYSLTPQASHAIAQGAVVPVFDDINNTQRIGPNDLGAVAH